MLKLDFEESQNIEYKESWRDEYLKWICGFANAHGGKIYIGVNDSLEVVGVEEANKLMEDIPNKIVNYLGIVCDVNLFVADSRNYIEIIVEPNNMPISYHGKYHYRSGSTKQELNGVALQQFIMKKTNVTWESMVLDLATFDDINEDSVRYFQRLAVNIGRLPKSCKDEPAEQTLKRLHVMTPDGKLTMAALLLFGKDIEQWCPNAIFRIGRFGVNDGDLISSDDVKCSLIMMPENVMQILRNKYMVSLIRYEGILRKETLEVPEEALREMLCNSIIHKDYQKSFIQMKIWNNRITLWNPGLLPEEFTVETLMESHESNPRNCLIARAFYYAGYVENWGRGYQKIKEEFALANLTLPTFEIIRGGLLATVLREKFMSLKEGGTQDGTQGGTQGGTQDIDKWIEFVIKQNPKITTEEMSHICGKGVRTIKRHISKLSHIKYVGSGYSGHWEILEKSEK